MLDGAGEFHALGQVQLLDDQAIGAPLADAVGEGLGREVLQDDGLPALDLSHGDADAGRVVDAVGLDAQGVGADGAEGPGFAGLQGVAGQVGEVAPHGDGDVSVEGEGLVGLEGGGEGVGRVLPGARYRLAVAGHGEEAGQIGAFHRLAEADLDDHLIGFEDGPLGWGEGHDPRWSQVRFWGRATGVLGRAAAGEDEGNEQPGQEIRLYFHCRHTLA